MAICVLAVLGNLATGCIAPPALTPLASPDPQVVATRWMALFDGELQDKDGCLSVCAAHTDECHVLAWPPEFEPTVRGDELVVVAGFGQGETWVFHLGAAVSVGGGEYGTTISADDRARYRIPEGCPGPYWMFGGSDAVKMTPPPE
jgi:hypothetical protein